MDQRAEKTEDNSDSFAERYRISWKAEDFPRTLNETLTTTLEILVCKTMNVLEILIYFGVDGGPDNNGDKDGPCRIFEEADHDVAPNPNMSLRWTNSGH